MQRGTGRRGLGAVACGGGGRQRVSKASAQAASNAKGAGKAGAAKPTAAGGAAKASGKRRTRGGDTSEEEELQPRAQRVRRQATQFSPGESDTAPAVGSGGEKGGGGDGAKQGKAPAARAAKKAPPAGGKPKSALVRSTSRWRTMGR